MKVGRLWHYEGWPPVALWRLATRAYGTMKLSLSQLWKSLRWKKHMRVSLADKNISRFQSFLIFQISSFSMFTDFNIYWFSKFPTFPYFLIFKFPAFPYFKISRFHILRFQMCLSWFPSYAFARFLQSLVWSAVIVNKNISAILISLLFNYFFSFSHFQFQDLSTAKWFEDFPPIPDGVHEAPFHPEEETICTTNASRSKPPDDTISTATNLAYLEVEAKIGVFEEKLWPSTSCIYRTLFSMVYLIFVLFDLFHCFFWNYPEMDFLNWLGDCFETSHSSTATCAI